MALRELALRRTADRVEDDVQAYRADKAIAPRLEDRGVAALLRRSRGRRRPRRAQRRPPRDAARRRMDRRLRRDAARCAPARGGAGADPAHGEARAGARRADCHSLGRATRGAAIVDYARSHNCSKLIVGRNTRGARGGLGRGIAERTAALAPEIDLIEIGRGETPQPSVHRGRTPAPPVDDARRRQAAALRLGAGRVRGRRRSIAIVLVPYFDLANIVMLFLLAVVLVGVRWGRGPGVIAAFVSVAAFDFFCVPPRFSFAVSDAQYLLTFAVMLAVALIIGQMTAGLRYQARIAAYREERSRALYEFARDLSSLLLTDDVVDDHDAVIGRTFRGDVAVYVLDDSDRLKLRPEGDAARTSTPAPRNGRSTTRRRRASGPTRWPGANSSTCRCARRCARAACSPSSPRIAARPAGSGAEAAARHVRRAGGDRAGARPLRRGRAERPAAHGVGTAAQFTAGGAVARPAHAARLGDRPCRIARADGPPAVGRAAGDPRRRSPRKRAG